MRILFVNPPRWNMIQAPQTVDITFLGHRFPPLGLLYVATMVKQETDHVVELFDYELGHSKHTDILPTLRHFQPDLIALTTYTYTLYDAYEVCKVIHQHNRDLPIVIGGPHVEAYPYETFEQPWVDLLVKGEGEYTFLEVLEAYEGRRKRADIKGIYYRDPNSGDVVFTGDRPTISDLDSLPTPDRTLLKDIDYHSVLNPGVKEATLISSRGCPYKCNFCSMREQRYRYRSAKSLADEVEACKAMGYNTVQFVDDTFNLFDKKVMEFCQELIDRKLEINWVFRGRVDHMNPQLAAKLAESGCTRVYFGVESGNAEVLASTLKGVTLEQVRYAVQCAKDAGIEVLTYFMIGFPDETPQQMEETVDFAIALQPHYVQVTITIPLPGTPLYDDALATGAIPGDYFAEYTRRPVRVMRGITWNKHLSERQLVRKLKRFYRRYYFRPSYMLARATEPRNSREFGRKAMAMYQLARYVVSPPDLPPFPDQYRHAAKVVGPAG